MSDPAAGASTAWQLFAWHGIQLELPEDWNPGVVAGTAEDGYCRIDDAETVRVQVKWQHYRSRKPIARIVDEYLANLARKHKGKKLPFPVRRDTRMVLLDDVDIECFEWLNESASSINLAALCRRCKRISIVRVMSDARERLRPMAKRILRSFRDHAPGAHVPWSVYGLRFVLPENYTPDKYAFQTGRLHIRLQARRREAEAVRLGLAGIVLRKQSLAEVVKKDAIAKSWADGTTFDETEVNAHDGVEATIVPRVRLRRFFLRNRKSLVRAWHCENSNAIYIAQWSGPGEQTREFEEFVESFVCH